MTTPERDMMFALAQRFGCDYPEKGEPDGEYFACAGCIQELETFRDLVYNHAITNAQQTLKNTLREFTTYGRCRTHKRYDCVLCDAVNKVLTSCVTKLDSQILTASTPEAQP